MYLHIEILSKETLFEGIEIQSNPFYLGLILGGQYPKLRL